MRWREIRSALKYIFGKSVGKRLLGRSGNKWEGSIKTDLTEI
jgi:hypothetical protein